MATNKTARDSMALIVVVIALVAVVILNIVADRAFVRVDLTKERRYSLTQPFRNILDRVKDPVKLTYYVSGTVPLWWEQTKRDILDKLGEIRTASGDLIELEVVDPAVDKEARKKLAEKGLEFEVSTREKDKMTRTVLFTSLEVTYQDKPAAFIPIIQRAEDLEYELANKLMELTLKKKPIVAIHAPKPEQPMMNPMMQRKPPSSGFEWILRGEGEEKKFDVRDVEFTESSTIPADTALLIIIRPKELSERARYEITKYLAGGGRVMLLSSPFKVNMEFGMRAEKTPNGLEGYLQDMGLTWAPGFVCDSMNVKLIESVNPFTGDVKMATLPFFVQIMPENVDQESPITRMLPNLVMPFPSEMVLDEAKAKTAGITAHVLARTSKQSWSEPYNDVFDPKTVDEKRAKFDTQKPVFVQLEGQFPFAWDGKPAPEWAKKADPHNPDAEKDSKDDKKKDGEVATVAKKPGMLMVWSCPDSFHSMYLSQRELAQIFSGNRVVIPNVAEIASLGEDLIRIRAKTYETRAIDRLDTAGHETTKSLVKAFLTIGVPLIVIAFWFVYWMIRRGAQIRYERSYAQTTGPSSFSP